MNTLRKSVASGILISLGAYGILVIENHYISALLFTLGLLTICKLKLNLFTGKCGFVFEDHAWKDLGITLVGNLIAGYLLGLAYSFVSADLVEIASARVSTWNLDVSFLVRSMLCGVLMYVAVKLYREGTILGIIIGIPMFILCGFQHCIANVVYMGVARTFHPALLISILGNMAGSLLIWFFTKDIPSRNNE
ncbi:MAG: formate/nitrite transporter family protein [Lachnospiraceae bacterium]|jgi:formate/nitrite transporter FocA (FNT family)|nr:formate/nitrite transporter family protein [Lachnospiraceae bacterium]